MIRAAIFALLLAAPAHAGPDRLSVLLGSHHANIPGTSGVNPGLFLTWQDRAFGLDWSLGAYRNSFGRLSVAATAAWPVWRGRDGQISLFTGIAHYPRDGRRFALHLGDVVPLAGVQLRYRRIFAQIMPGDGRFSSAVLSVGFTFPLSRRY